LFLGFFLFLINLLVDLSVSSGILGQDAIYDLRRIEALSLYSSVLLVFFILVGDFLSLPFGITWLLRLSLLGFSAALILRLTVFSTTSFADYRRLVAASLFQPLSWVIPFLVVSTNLGFSVLLFLVFSIIVSLAVTLAFTFSLNSVGKQMLGVSSLSLLKAFLLNWIADLNAPIEGFLEKLGEVRAVEASLIQFGSPRPKAVIVVPSVHPGPFKNVGSSLLPSRIKSALEKKLDCTVCVPHGLLGHEFDLASQHQTQRVVDKIVESADFGISEGKTTPFVDVCDGLATASCQIFGKTALLSFSLAPKTTEDFPQELGLFVRPEAEKQGLNGFVVVNAHNSIDGAVNAGEAFDSLKKVGVACLEKAAALRQSSFEVGAATVFPKEYGLKDGMGPGGITVVVVKVDEQKTAYVVIDGNNIVSGLREKILSELNSCGISKGEIFTTDTHSVNAIILSKRGYHPVGDAMDYGILIKYIKEGTLAALSSLESVKVASENVTVSDAKVIGEKQLEALCLLVDKTLQRAKKIVVPMFAAVGLLLMLILMYV
jgi:putative membrane protein